MAVTQVEVPSLGESVTQAILVSWHKKDGESVALDEPLCELETDKANVDIPAPVAGVLRRMREEGETVHVGEPIARIDPNGKAAAPSTAPAAAGVVTLQPVAPGSPADPMKSPGIPSTAASSSSDSTQRTPPGAPNPSQPPVPLEDLSPAVRTLVMEKNIDVRAVPATGPGGRVTKEDVLNYLEKQKNGNGAAHPAPPSQPHRQHPPHPLPARKSPPPPTPRATAASP